MPRMKKIDMGQQKMADIKNKVIEVKDCTAAELVFLHPLTQEESDLIKETFHYEVTEKVIKVPRFKNSWKGLVFFLLTLTHIRYSEKITAWVTDIPKSGLFASEDYNYAFECKNYFGRKVEILPKVPGYNRCYICCRLETINIEKSIRGFAEILGIDEKSSMIGTAYAKVLPHAYFSKTVDFPPLQLKPRMLSGIEEFFYPVEYKKKLDEDYIEFQKNEHETKLLEYLEETKL